MTNLNKALGIDLGDSRIGLALSDDLGLMAHPLETVPAKENPLARIVEIVRQHNIQTIVLGMPRNMDGTYGAAAEKIKTFRDALKAAVSCQIILWDERLTTVAAQKSLHQAGKNVKKSRAVIDQVAAQLILQGWLDSMAFKL